MKIDFCVINPPYNDVVRTKPSLHYKFLYKALEIAETVVSIQPSTWIIQEKNQPNLPINGRGAEIAIFDDCVNLFQGAAAMRESISISMFSHKKQGVLVDWNTGYRTKYDDILSIDMIDRYTPLKSIIQKGNIISDDREVRHIYGQGGGETARGNHVIKDGSLLKDKWIVQLAPLIPNAVGRLNKWGLFTYGESIPVYQHDGSPDKLVGYAYHIFNTEREARNCYAYLASDLVRAYCIAYKSNQHIVQKACPHIPWPATFDTDPALWTNEAISDRAGLIPAERAWLKEILPDCYNIRI